MTAPFSMTLLRPELDVLCAFSSHDPGRINLFGVGFARRARNVLAWATDGHRLFLVSASDDGPDVERFIVPLDAMQEARRILDREGPVSVLQIERAAESQPVLDALGWRRVAEGKGRPPPVWEVLSHAEGWTQQASTGLCFNPRLVADLGLLGKLEGHRGWWATIPPGREDPIRLDCDLDDSRSYAAMVMPVRMDRPLHAPELR